MALARPSQGRVLLPQQRCRRSQPCTLAAAPSQFPRSGKNRRPSCTAQQEPGQTVKVSISTHFQAAFGEGLKVVGSHSALGQWDVTAAPDMRWTPGHRWVAQVSVPVQSHFEFKIVHLSGHGICWEPSENRPFTAELGEGEVPDEPALDVACAFGYPELTAVQLADAADLEPAAGENVWDPATHGLPADLTHDLSTRAAKALEAHEESAALGEALPAAAGPAITSWEDVRLASPEFQAEAVGSPNNGAPGAEKTGQSALTPRKGERDLGTMGKAASFAAVGLAAGVLMSALAIDLTDAAVASAIVAAGATLLPAKDAAVAKRAASAVLSGGLGATEAIARGLGLKSHVERRAAAEAAGKARGAGGEAGAGQAEGTPDAPAPAVAVQLAEAELLLAASIAEAEALLGSSSVEAEANVAAEVAPAIIVVPMEIPAAGVSMAIDAMSAAQAEEAPTESVEESAQLEIVVQ